MPALPSLLSLNVETVCFTGITRGRVGLGRITTGRVVHENRGMYGIQEEIKTEIIICGREGRVGLRIVFTIYPPF